MYMYRSSNKNNSLIADDSLTEYLEAYSNYYEIKNYYDSQISKIKKNIKTTNLDERKTKFLRNKAKIKCFKCNETGGMIFEETGRMLSVTCGTENPCELNIQIEKNKAINFQDKYSELLELSNKIKSQIINTKLMLLFDLEQEDVSIQAFESKKYDLMQILKDINELEKYFKNISKISKSSQEQMVKITKDEYRKNLLLEINKKNKKMNDMMEKYESLNELEKKQKIEEVVQEYINEILPRYNDYVSNIYDIFEVIENDDNEKVLIKEKVSIDKMLKNDNFKVISNIK